MNTPWYVWVLIAEGILVLGLVIFATVLSVKAKRTMTAKKKTKK